MNEVLLLQGLIGGLVFGAIYALIGASLNVMVGVLRVINFAHGESSWRARSSPTRC